MAPPPEWEEQTLAFLDAVDGCVGPIAQPDTPPGRERRELFFSPAGGGGETDRATATVTFMDIEVVESVDAGELVALYGAVGWSAYAADPEALAGAISRSTYVVTARQEGDLIGLARGLSDDISIFYLQDILVLPGWQRRGVGRALLSACLERFAHVRQKVLLTDDEDRQHRFYESMGYRDIRTITSAGLRAFVQIEGLGPDPERVEL